MAQRTYEWSLENIQRFADALPEGLKVSELKPYHLTAAMEPFTHWANNTKHDFISAVKRAFSWAVDEERIEKNPLARVKKPAPRPGSSPSCRPSTPRSLRPFPIRFSAT